jgi:hypothetical protein
MKKDVPNIINVEFESDILFHERLTIQLIGHNIESGYSISEYDLDRYFAAVIRNFGLEKLSESDKNYCFKNGKLKDRIRYNIIRAIRESNRKPSRSNFEFYKNYMRRKIDNRNAYMIKEINRTGINGKKEFGQQSEYFKQLKKIVSQIEDEVTLLVGDIPVKIRFEELVHIFVKHVEETKFGDGQFANRTFFNYNFDQIWTLLKCIIKQEKSEIFDHFEEVKVGLIMKDKSLVNDYHRGFKKFNPIEYNNDTFALSIKANGYIQKFHQL